MANLVTSEKILPLIEPAIKDVDVDIEQNDTKNLVVRFTTSDRISLRPAVEQILTDNNITFGDITNKTLAGTFGGTQIDTYDLKRVRLRYKAPQGGGARGGGQADAAGAGGAASDDGEVLGVVPADFGVQQSLESHRSREEPVSGDSGGGTHPR